MNVQIFCQRHGIRSGNDVADGLWPAQLMLLELLAPDRRPIRRRLRP